MLKDKLLSVEEAAELLGVSPLTLRMWKYKKKGPKSVKVGNRIKFRLSDLDTYVANLK